MHSNKSDDTNDDEFDLPPMMEQYGIVSTTNTEEFDENDLPPPMMMPTNGDGNVKVNDVKGDEDKEDEWDCKLTYDLEWTKVEGNDKVNEYLVLQNLGEGSFGRVKLAERQAGDEPFKKYAIKMMSKIRLKSQREFVHTGDGGMKAITALDKVQQEVEVMRHLYHRNVILLFEVLEDFENEQELFLVLEYMANGPSMKYYKEDSTFRSPITGGVLPEDLGKSHFRDLVKGLNYIHEKGIIHRDIKPENLLLTEANTLRISDFGCAVQLPEDHIEDGILYDNAGTYYFFSPECCSGKGYSGYSNDLWAATICLYIFLFGTLPFHAEGIEPLFNKIINDDPELLLEGFTSQLSDVFENLFQKDPSQRMQIKQVLESPWVRETENQNLQIDSIQEEKSLETVDDDGITF